MTSLDDVRSRFIVDEEMDEKKTAAIVEMASQFAKVGKSGMVFFERHDLTNMEKVALVLVSRFLGSLLDPEIPRFVTVTEISEMTGVDEKQVRSRISDLRDNQLRVNLGDQGYCLTGLFEIERFLRILCGKHRTVSLGQ